MGVPFFVPGWHGSFGPAGSVCRGVCNTPLPGYPAKFAGVRRRPYAIRPYMYPAKFAGVRRRPPRVSPAQGFRRPGFRPGLWSTGPTARPGTGERPVGAPDHSQGRNPWCVDDRGETPGRAGYPMRSNTGGLTTRRIIPKAGTPGGMLWASSRRPTRGERRRRRGLRAARSAGC